MKMHLALDRLPDGAGFEPRVGPQRDGTFLKLTKKEASLLTEEKDRLERFLGGIKDMPRLPAALFIVDLKKSHIAV